LLGFDSKRISAWYWIDSGWGCGGVRVDGKGIVVEGAPIFWKFKGNHLQKLASYHGYKIKKINKKNG